MVLAEIDITSIISGATPLPITLLIITVWHLKKRVDVLQDQVTKLHGIAVAVKSCPVSECKLKELKPELVV